METSKNTRKRIIDYLEEGKRFDGRKLLELRNLEIETGISINSEGSARVRLGQTEVVAGVKLDIGAPYPNELNRGTLVVTTELLPMASERFEYGPPSIAAIEISRIVDRTVRESKFINFEKLCVKEGEKVWCIFLDIYPINDAGNLADAACIASVAALLSAVFPKYDEKIERVVYGEFTDKKLPLSGNVPLLLTFHKIGGNIVIDPITEEEDASDVKISLGMTKDKEVKINAGQKEKETAFPREEIFEIFDKAEDCFEKIHPVILEKIKKAIESPSQRKD